MTKQAKKQQSGEEKPKREQKKLPALPLRKLLTHSDLTKLTQRFGPACINALADEVANGSGSARVSAANALLDRGYGKVGQSIELSGKDGRAIELEHIITPAVEEFLMSLRGEA